MNIKNRQIPSAWGVTMNHPLYSLSEEKSHRLAVLFPGMHYSCKRPVLHYAAKCALQAGCDVLQLEYGYQAAKTEIKSDEEYASIVKECAESVAEVLPSYDEIVLVGKSFGTIVAGEVSSKLMLGKSKHLFLTPVESSIPYIHNKQGMTIYGTGDPAFSSHLAAKIQVGSDHKIIAVPRADHGFEVEDALETIDIMKQLIAHYVAFFNEGLSTT
ncbi:alpha/beta hydrolase [Paenibacillus sp. 1001270B_150601_E10]|uniref:alpha/beta hydrolase n=1 Tax=Paenibacillus sp. 1001270B_150601_E10 TaxID=2787079 RepID=UPI00189D5CAF|nr:alpha/beta hydrolase [Paenibacillus sp. 1001270B_150601_E10]